MGEFFGSMYCWFEDFFGMPLAEFLWGQTTDINRFITIGWWMLVISLVLFVLYYYVINHPWCNKAWTWLVVLLVAFGIHFVVGWQWVLNLYWDFDLDHLSDDQHVEEASLLKFGVSNAFLGAMWFIIFTFVGKWWSRNVSHSPI